MVLQTVFTTGVTGGNARLELPVFTTIVFAIVFGWLLVSVWQRVLENFSYETLGLNSRSTIHALIVAIVTTIAFLAFVWMIDEYAIIPAGEAAGAVEGATEGILSGASGPDNPITSSILGSTRYGHPIVITPTNFF